MRRLIGFGLVLVVLLVVGDRIACRVAQGQIAARIQSTERLSARPVVTIHGFPFVTQALKGRYQRVDAQVKGLSVRDGLTIDSLNVELRGLRVTIPQVLHGVATRVPVDSAGIVATVGYPSLQALAKANLPNKGLDVKFAQGRDNRLAITGSYAVPQIKIQIDAQAKVSVSNGDLVVGLLPSSMAALPGPVRSQLSSVLGNGYKLPPLPFGFQAKSVTVGPAGITVRAAATSVKLG